jgi:putative FmdB family regulatory protein
MPLYEYQCEECNTVFERLVFRSQSAVQMTCPQCGSPRTAKVFSTFSTTVGSNVLASNAGNSRFS